MTETAMNENVLAQWWDTANQTLQAETGITV